MIAEGARHPGPWRYRAYGVTLEARMPFPELASAVPEAGADVDVHVGTGRVPHALERPVTSGAFFMAAPEQYLLQVPGVGRYLATGGHTVTIDPESSAPATDVRTFFLGPVMTALQHQRGALVLHGAAVRGARGAVVIVGPSGMGKSTLLAALAARGVPVLADDAAVVTQDRAGAIVVHPGVPHVRLWADAATRLGHTPEGLRRAREGLDKFLLPLAAAFHQRAEPLDRIFVLAFSSGGRVEQTPIHGAEAFKVVQRETRNRRVLDGLGMRQAHFGLAAAASRVSVVRLSRPRGRDSLDELVRCLEPTLR